MRKSLRGFEAVIEASVRAGCRAFISYPSVEFAPITQAAARSMPRVGGRILQAESEDSAMRMASEAAALGLKVLLPSSAARDLFLLVESGRTAEHEIPCVIVHTRTGSHEANYRERAAFEPATPTASRVHKHSTVLAPNSVQEISDLTFRAFDLADRYRCPQMLLAEETLVLMTESVEMPETPPGWGPGRYRRAFAEPGHAAGGAAQRLAEIREIEHEASEWQEYRLSDAVIVVVAFGAASRWAQAAVDLARGHGIRAGLFRPITLSPFPSPRLAAVSSAIRVALVVELGLGSLLEDVSRAVAERTILRHMSATEDKPPKPEDILAVLGMRLHEYA